jgi:hypothetical protein
MSQQMEFEFAKVRHLGNQIQNRIIFNLGELALTACLPGSR